MPFFVNFVCTILVWLKILSNIKIMNTKYAGHFSTDNHL